MHANWIVRRYKVEEAVFKDKAVLINVNRFAAEKESVYEAVQYAWKLDPKKAAKASRMVLSACLVRGTPSLVACPSLLRPRPRTK